MIDFTHCEVNKFKAYGDANGNKINVLYGGKSYMLKFPPLSVRNKAMRYTNGCLSEYLACHIFEALEFKTQETEFKALFYQRRKPADLFAHVCVSTREINLFPV
jgi:hypothetical protein